MARPHPPPGQAPYHGNPDKDYGIFKALFGAFGFPFGFTTIVVCGAELYTSICSYGAAAWWEGKVRGAGRFTFFAYFYYFLCFTLLFYVLYFICKS
jgi:formate/nitrite transporter FocA (FNT family)